MKKNIPPTRMELLKLQKRKKLAERGHTLLEKKRDALIHKFLERIDTYKDLKKEVYQELQEAYTKLHITQAINGVDVVKSVGDSQQQTFELEKSNKNLMGITVPTYTIKKLNPPENIDLLGTSKEVKESRQNFQYITKKIIELAEIEETIYLLAEEIKKTKRRVNSLEHIKIPTMEEQEKKIVRQLDELEREEFIRLKKIKESL